MGSVPLTALAVTLFALAPVAAWAQSGGNPWNPYSTPQAQVAPAPLVRPTPEYVAPQQAPSSPSRFAPPGLEQQLTTGPQRQFAPVAPSTQVAPPPNYQAPVPQATVPQAYAAPAPQYTAPVARSAPVPNPVPGGYGNVPGYAPQGYGYAPYGPGYGGYPQGYRNNGYSGYGTNGPYTPYSIPGGLGGFAPFPGNNTNGGVPGFNFSPFGFF